MLYLVVVAAPMTAVLQSEFPFTDWFESDQVGTYTHSSGQHYSLTLQSAYI